MMVVVVQVRVVVMAVAVVVIMVTMTIMALMSLVTCVVLLFLCRHVFYVTLAISLAKATSPMLEPPINLALVITLGNELTFLHEL